MVEKNVNEDYKKNRTIKRLKIFGIVTVLIIAFVIVFMISFRLQNVIVDGNVNYSEDEIIEAMGANGSHNTLFYYLEHRDDTGIDSLPYIDSVKVSMEGNNTIIIQVVEKTVVGCIESAGMYYYFDKDGTILRSNTSRDENIPLVTGVETTITDLYQKISLENNMDTNLLQLTLLLNKYEIIVKNIRFDDEGYATLYIGDIKVDLGSGDNLEDKIANLADVLPSLKGRKGTLDLADYDSTKEYAIFRQE